MCTTKLFLFTYAVVPLERVQDALRLMKQPSNVRVDAYAVTCAEMGICRLSAQLPVETRHSRTVPEANRLLLQVNLSSSSVLQRELCPEPDARVRRFPMIRLTRQTMRKAYTHWSRKRRVNSSLHEFQRFSKMPIQYSVPQV